MSSLTKQYRLTAIKHRKKIPTGIDGALYRTWGRYKSRRAISQQLMKHAVRIQEKAVAIQDLSTVELKAQIAQNRVYFQRHSLPDDEVLFTSLALVHEAAYRALSMRPYTVQTAGALALLRGYIAEMATGEGKTLTAALAAVIRGWSKLPCHVVTANDYLAERDAQKLEPLYTFCGVSVGHVISTLNPQQRKKGYAADITYSTAKEVTADFLRDRIALGGLQKFERRLLRQVVHGKPMHNDQVVMRGLHAAIIDEADSLLIDEAVTPLIISQQQENEEFNEACRTVSQVASNLVAGTDYTVDFKHKDVMVNPKLDMGELFAHTTMPRQYSGIGFRRELLRQALTAREFFHRDKQYVIQEEKVVIVDEFTGRIMPQRSWSDGLHQMVEVKEGVPITPPNVTLARISFQRFFRYYHYLSGMTGTAHEAMGELWQVYDLPVVAIPRNRPCQRISYPTRIFRSQQEKWDAIADEIKLAHATGRPILVGTRSVETSEQLAQRLLERGLHCEVINAVRHSEEASIISRAGVHGAITVATNMAGRGTDILLDPISAEKGGLYVIATEFHETARIDRQLYGRSGRQGDKGSDRTFAALDDELVRRHAGAVSQKLVSSILAIQTGVSEKIARLIIKQAQSKAQRKAAASRNDVQKMDLWLDDSLSFTREEVQ